MVNVPNCAYVAFWLRWKLVCALGGCHGYPHIIDVGEIKELCAKADGDVGLFDVVFWEYGAA
jgi:hypothetical protein